MGDVRKYIPPFKRIYVSDPKILTTIQIPPKVIPVPVVIK